MQTSAPHRSATASPRTLTSAQSNVDRQAIAERIRGLLTGPFGGDLTRAAAHLGIEQASLRASLRPDECEVRCDVIVAVSRLFRLDPRWLVTGECSSDGTALAALASYVSETTLREYVESLLRMDTETVDLPASRSKPPRAERGARRFGPRGGRHEKGPGAWPVRTPSHHPSAVPRPVSVAGTGAPSARHWHGIDDTQRIGRHGVPAHGTRSVNPVPLREFTDSSGRLWRVWEVQPRWIERRNEEHPEIVAVVGERRTRRSGEIRVRFDSELAFGWLAFECESDRRRLHPVPIQWMGLADAELRALLERATTISRPNRRIE